MIMSSIGRNDPCPCGSGKKYKKCCLVRDESAQSEEASFLLSEEMAEEIIKSSQSCPVDRCLINKGWQKKGMAHIMVVRRKEDGHFILGGYLVDLLCLGVKNAFCHAGLRSKDLDEALARFREREAFEAIDFNHAKEIIFGGIEYARKLGFEPHRDFKLAREVLGTDETVREHAIRFGDAGGRPLFVSGPDDDVDAILEKLSKPQE